MKKFFYSLLLAIAVQGAAAQQNTSFSLIDLPYPTNGLEPVISQTTIELHHGKHLQGYVNNVNKLVKDTSWEGKTIEDIVRGSEGSLYDNAGQMLNHNLYFTAFSPNGGGEPTGPLADAIKAKWESVDHFKEAFVKAGTSLFGSGWVWLAKDGNGQLLIETYPNGGNPVRDNLTPLLGFDVWEHAYYLDYQNRRADHLKALWKIVDWNVVSQRFTDSRPEKRDEP